MTKKAPSKKRTGPRPTGKVRVTMYQVGFGDCFLVSFAYDKGRDRHVLIDCGTSTERKNHMDAVVTQIGQDCDGRLDGLVVTHRHSDHLSAFGLAGVGERLAALRPEAVVQPWTEHPRAKAQARKAPAVFSGQALAYLDALTAAQHFADQLLTGSTKLLGGAALGQQLAFIGGLSIPNKAAVQRLARMGKRRAYVHAGSKSGLESVLPGVQVSVLGPPTLEQCADIKSPAKWDESEFWKLQAGLARAAAARRPQARAESALFPRAHTAPIATAAPSAKWAVNRMNRAHVEDLRRIVRAMDDALNNTSVILLFEVGGKALLFPGDAQLENWLYALDDDRIKARLRGTDLYKVGHHGSTNATPQSLWKLFRNRGAETKRRRLTALLSTKEGKHERVPRASLVAALKRDAKLRSTDDWPARHPPKETYDL